MLVPRAGFNICSIVPIYLHISTTTSELLATGIVLCCCVWVQLLNMLLETELETFHFRSSTLLLSVEYARPISTSTCHQWVQYYFVNSIHVLFCLYQPYSILLKAAMFSKPLKEIIHGQCNLRSTGGIESRDVNAVAHEKILSFDE